MIQKDKLLYHPALGIFAAVWALVLVLIPAPVEAKILATGLVVGAGYEFQQAIRKEGTPDPMDALATFIGSAIVAFIYWLL